MVVKKWTQQVQSAYTLRKDMSPTILSPEWAKKNSEFKPVVDLWTDELCQAIAAQDKQLE